MKTNDFATCDDFCCLHLDDSSFITNEVIQKIKLKYKIKLD